MTGYQVRQNLGDGQTRCDLSLPAVNATFEETADVLAGLAPTIRRHFKDRAAHRQVGTRLIAAWQDGIGHSPGFADRTIVRGAIPTGAKRAKRRRSAPGPVAASRRS